MEELDQMTVHALTTLALKLMMTYVMEAQLMQQELWIVKPKTVQVNNSLVMLPSSFSMKKLNIYVCQSGEHGPLALVPTPVMLEPRIRPAFVSITWV